MTGSGALRCQVLPEGRRYRRGVPIDPDEMMPRPKEIRDWAYSGDVEPMQDWDVILGESEYVPLLFELIGDPDCPGRRSLLGALYCYFGHTSHADVAVLQAVADGEQSTDGWIRAWAVRARRALDQPTSFTRQEWCGWDGLRASPDG